MDTLIFKTELRKKLLGYSFAHLDESYYVRELSNIIDVDAGNLSRELRKLEKEGLYHSFSKGKEKFYSLNKDYPLFKELKTIIFKTMGVEGSLRKLVSKYTGIKHAFIYGSYAKSKESKTSDIDLILTADNFPKNNFTSEIRSLEDKLGREINFTCYNEKEFQAEKQKQGGFLNILLKNKIIILKGRLDDK